MANKGTIKTGFTTSGTGYALGTSYDSSKSYLVSTIFDWEIKSQDVMNGTSTIAWKLSVDCSTLSRYDSDAVYVTVGGATKITSDLGTHHSATVAQTRVEDGETKQISSGEFTVSHSANGSRILNNFRVSTDILGVYDEDGTSIHYIASAALLDSILVSITLDTIVKQGVILTAPNFNDEQSPTVTYAIPKESTAAWVGIAIAGSTMTIPYRTVAVTSSSYTFSFTQAEKEALWAILARGLNTAEARFYIKTTCNGQTLESYVSRTLEIINYMPTLDPEVYDTNTDVINRLTGNKYILVRYASNAAFTTGGQARKGATIDTQAVKNGENTKYGASGTFEKVTANEFNFSITDNYGRTTRETMQFDTSTGKFIEYVKLTCAVSVTEMTADGDVQITLSGKYFNGSFGKKQNTLRLNYDIAKNNEDWEHVDKGYIYPTMNGSDYTYTFTLTNLDYLSVYELTIRVSDEIAVQGLETQTVLASTPIFDWGRTDFNFNVPVNIEGDLTVAGNITAGGNTVPTIQAQGTAGIWTYRTWSDGTAECWGKKDVSVTFPSTANWGGLFTTGAISGSNVSFPYGLFAETPVVNASLLIRSAGGILMAPGGAGSNIANWDQTGVYEIARGSYVSGTQYYTINYQVIGRWK